MVDTNFPQYRMLKKIEKHSTLSTKDFTEEQFSICDYLEHLGFVEANLEYSKNYTGLAALPPLECTSYTITQAGKAQISAFKSAYHKWWISVIISIISLIIAILALLRQLLIL